MDIAIEGAGLEKTFVKKRTVPELVRHPFRKAERIRALRGVDLAVPRGTIFGLLGPNGAGKTTLLKILSCLVLPDRGRARILGTDVLDENRVKPTIGLVNSDERSFYWRLSGRENLRFFSRLYDVPRARSESRIEELLRRVDLVEASDRRFADYSSGMKQRLAIARALLHDPPVLLMDEPTRSLDPASSLSLRAFVSDELRKRDGKTILLATHNLREAEVLCDRIAILVRGKIRQVGTPAGVRRWGVSERRFRLEVSAWPEAASRLARILSDETVEDGRRLLVAMEGEGTLDALLRAIHEAGGRVHACDRVEPDLEDAFSRILEAERET